MYRKRYDKDKLMHQSFIEEKLSNMSNMLPGRFVGLLTLWACPDIDATAFDLLL